MQWQPTSNFDSLKKRAKLIQRIRAFFVSADYIEVETPLLAAHTVTDRYIDSIACQLTNYKKPYYLQTSPEYGMKRLLAAGSGPIFQICKAFRQEEQGRQHHHEFTLLEWYRPGYTHIELMHEVSQLLSAVIDTPAAEYVTYQDIFHKHLHINPHTITTSDLHTIIQQRDLYHLATDLDRDTCLQLLMTDAIEPQLGHQQPCIVYHYPASQAALAKINQTVRPAVAERFELYLNGCELANGFHELNDPIEQRQRFQADQDCRQQQKQTHIEMDENFLACLPSLPYCAGVALGLDRLLMLYLGLDHIEQAISFR